MKKNCLFLALALVCAGAVFGQSGKKNALSVDVAPLFRSLVVTHSGNPDTRFFGAGLFYERLLGSRYSLGGRFDFIQGEYSNSGSRGETDITYLAGSLHGRVYPLSQGLEKLYLDAGIGFNAITIDGPLQKDKEGGMTFALKMGYKQFFNGLIFVEPSIAFVYAERISPNINMPSFQGPQDPSPFEWTPGLLIGVSF
jgi:hypothetical protein